MDAMDIAPAGMPSDDLQTAIQEAQATLQQAGEAAPKRDPLRLVLAGLSAVLGIFARSTRRWERAVADVIAARDPLTGEERATLRADLAEAAEKGAYRGMRIEAQRVVRTLDRKQITLLGVTHGAALVIGLLVGGVCVWSSEGPPLGMQCGYGKSGQWMCWAPPPAGKQ
jgi:hypothetical protein